ncbi:hypothetical protein POVWA2_021560 [Plasmodium ovale wallikeri]|uniref:Uncharacterized protein n=1 Tax=Plasmodium ovale wallikeri TaxID=864142 RepID=A0A1A8YRN8_PLAOA|nr:hypothetical protein POVWA1_021580 [Plasmodium ovale wallikeri]SBT34754.1 hypothetical protein POVWA2_021560 [Plasmodium ovale wallikeri]
MGTYMYESQPNREANNRKNATFKTNVPTAYSLVHKDVPLCAYTYIGPSPNTHMRRYTASRLPCVTSCSTPLLPPQCCYNSVLATHKEKCSNGDKKVLIKRFTVNNKKSNRM